MTLEPSELGAADVRVVLEAGVSREAIREAMYVSFLFNVYDRLADTLAWHVPSQAAFESGARTLLSRGYK